MGIEHTRIEHRQNGKPTPIPAWDERIIAGVIPSHEDIPGLKGGGVLFESPPDSLEELDPDLLFEGEVPQIFHADPED